MAPREPRPDVTQPLHQFGPNQSTLSTEKSLELLRRTCAIPDCLSYLGGANPLPLSARNRLFSGCGVISSVLSGEEGERSSVCDLGEGQEGRCFNLQGEWGEAEGQSSGRLGPPKDFG
ncbi:unnamed protein product [Cochlearia groenlandica]